MNDKAGLRRQYIDARGGFSHGARVGANMSITQRVLSSEAFKAASCVMVYADFGGEASTSDIIRGALSMGKRIYLPVSDAESVKLAPYEIKRVGDLALGSYGIFEPDKNICKPVEISNIDFVLVPGLAFDLQGYRLGYGKGYYDRFLPLLKEYAITAGLAYEFQVVVRLPRETHDVKVKMLFTDERTIVCT